MKLCAIIKTAFGRQRLDRRCLTLLVKLYRAKIESLPRSILDFLDLSWDGIPLKKVTHVIIIIILVKEYLNISII